MHSKSEVTQRALLSCSGWETATSEKLIYFRLWLINLSTPDNKFDQQAPFSSKILVLWGKGKFCIKCMYQMRYTKSAGVNIITQLGSQVLQSNNCPQLVCRVNLNHGSLCTGHILNETTLLSFRHLSVGMKVDTTVSLVHCPLLVGGIYYTGRHRQTET